MFDYYRVTLPCSDAVGSRKIVPEGKSRRSSGILRTGTCFCIVPSNKISWEYEILNNIAVIDVEPKFIYRKRRPLACDRTLEIVYSVCFFFDLWRLCSSRKKHTHTYTHTIQHAINIRLRTAGRFGRNFAFNELKTRRFSLGNFTAGNTRTTIGFLLVVS